MGTKNGTADTLSLDDPFTAARAVGLPRDMTTYFPRRSALTEVLPEWRDMLYARNVSPQLLNFPYVCLLVFTNYVVLLHIFEAISC